MFIGSFVPSFKIWADVTYLDIVSLLLANAKIDPVGWI